MRLDAREVFPSGMEEYLSQYGWHFSKKMCEWAVSRMYKRNSLDKKIPIQSWNKDSVDKLLNKYGITIENKIWYDYIFAANMCIADYYGSSIIDEQHVALFIKYYVDDPDGYEVLPFTRFYANCILSGVPSNWEDML